MRGLLVALLVSGCQTAAATPTPDDVTAVIVRPTEKSRAALAEAVTIALEGRSVTLADDALTQSSALIVERTVRRDPNGNPVQGRVTEQPEKFRLVTSGGACVLVHERTGKRYRLVDTECAPEPR